MQVSTRVFMLSERLERYQLPRFLELCRLTVQLHLITFVCSASGHSERAVVEMVKGVSPATWPLQPSPQKEPVVHMLCLCRAGRQLKGRQWKWSRGEWKRKVNRNNSALVN